MSVKRTLTIGAIVLAIASPAFTQGQSVSADRFVLNTGPCVERSGSGTPEATVTGNVCDSFHRTDTGDLYYKTSGTGNTGWTRILIGSGTSGTIPKFGTAPTLVDSVIQESGGLIGIGGPPSQLLHLVSATNVNTIGLVQNTNAIGIAAAAAVRAQADTAIMTMFAHGTAKTATRYGLTVGGYSELVSTAGNGLLFGTSNATPAIIGTNNTEAFRVDSSQNLGTSNFASQTTGWRMTTGGALDLRNLFTDEMTAKSFTAILEQVSVGGALYSKSAAVVVTFTCPAASGTATLTVEDIPGALGMNVFEVNDAVVARSFSRGGGALTIGDCVGLVTAPSHTVTGQQDWTFTRNAGAAGGSITGGTVIGPKTMVIDYGPNGAPLGVFEINANDGAYGINGPWAQIKTWATAPTSGNFTTRCRFGNLNGITSVVEYGLLCGNFSGNAYVRFSNQNAEITGIPFILKDGGTVTMKLDPSVPSFALGSTLPSAFGTGAGVWMGKDTTYKFRVGDPAGDKLTYDTSGLTVVASTVSINPGITIAVPPNVNTLNYGYKFASAYSGTNFNGLFGLEDTTFRSLTVNNTTTTDKLIKSSLAASTNGTGGQLDVVADRTGTPTAYVQTSLNVGIGLGGSPTHLLQLGSDDAAKPTTNTWTIVSGAAAKEHIQPYTAGALDLIRQVQIHEFDYTGQFGQPKAHGIGPIADEIVELFPRSVKTAMVSRTPGSPPEPILTFNAHELWMANVQAVIELAREVETLKARLAALERKGGG